MHVSLIFKILMNCPFSFFLFISIKFKKYLLSEKLLYHTRLCKPIPYSNFWDQVCSDHIGYSFWLYKLYRIIVKEKSGHDCQMGFLKNKHSYPKFQFCFNVNFNQPWYHIKYSKILPITNCCGFSIFKTFL